MKIRKIQQKSVYFEMFEFDWMKVDQSSEFYVLENGHEIEAAMALKERKNSIHIVLIEVKHKHIGKKRGSILISFACKESLLRNINAVTLNSKTKLTKHYCSLGAKILFGERMVFEGKNLKKMAEKNLKKK